MENKVSSIDNVLKLNLLAVKLLTFSWAYIIQTKSKVRTPKTLHSHIFHICWLVDLQV